MRPPRSWWKPAGSARRARRAASGPAGDLTRHCPRPRASPPSSPKRRQELSGSWQLGTSSPLGSACMLSHSMAWLRKPAGRAQPASSRARPQVGQLTSRPRSAARAGRPPVCVTSVARSRRMDLPHHHAQGAPRGARAKGFQREATPRARVVDGLRTAVHAHGARSPGLAGPPVPNSPRRLPDRRSSRDRITVRNRW